MTTGVTASEIADIVERIGTWGLRFKPGYAFGTGTFTELPPASEDYQNLIAVVVGGAGEADQLWYCRKNADDSYEWIPLGVSETSLVLYRFQGFDETSSPDDLSSGGPLDPAANSGSLGLQSYRQARVRATVNNAPGTAAVVGEVQYSIDNTDTWHALPGCTFDFGNASTTTEWENLPAELLDPDAYSYMKVAVTGTGSANVTVNVFLDLRG